MYAKIVAHAKKHPHYNAAVHFIGGVGLGIILARPIFTTHPLRWGIFFLAVSLFGHVYPIWGKK